MRHFPRKPFENLEAALKWVEDFVRWCNDEHLHGAIRRVTPSDRHAGKDQPLLANRHEVYTKLGVARRGAGPSRPRNWSPVGAVYLNPIKQEVRVNPIASPLQ